MQYFKTLRKFLGHDPIQICGASVIVVNDDRILLQRRMDNDCWAYPGGVVELGENVEEAAVREVFEETGITVKDLKLFGVFSGKELFHTYANGDQIYIVDIVYITNNFEGEIKADNFECRDAAFVRIDELPENISPPAKPAIKEFIKQYDESKIACLY